MQNSSNPPEFSDTRMPYRTARKKNPKTNEDIWPHDLEVCLIDALKEFRGRQKRTIGRCRYVSEYIEQQTGVYRSAQQVSSRLQMIVKNGKNSDLTNLILSTQRKSPTRQPNTFVFRLSPSPRQKHDEDNIQTPSPLSSNARLSASPYSEPLDTDQDVLNSPLSIHPPFDMVDGRAIDNFYNPGVSTVPYNFNHTDLLQEQANPYDYNNGYLQQAATFQQQYPAQQNRLPDFNNSEIHPGVGGEPNFQPDDASLWEWFYSQYL